MRENLFAVFNRHSHVLPALAVFQRVKFFLLLTELLQREAEQTLDVDEPAVELVLRRRQLLLKEQMSKERLQKKTILRGNFSHVGRPTPTPPVWERPCHKNFLRFILCFRAS